MPRFGSVVFDCDSTLSALEGIDWLAGGDPAIRELTDAAMRGEVPLQEVYGRRLDIVSPGRDRVQALGERYIQQLVPGAGETVAALAAAGVPVRIVSGGLLPALLLLARHLGLPDDAVAGVEIRFADDGSYAGFDADSPLTHSDGKARVIQGWLPQLKGPLLMVGDGVTDLRARPPADAFAAFTGVIARPEVTSSADFVAEDMAAVRAFVLGPE